MLASCVCLPRYWEQCLQINVRCSLQDTVNYEGTVQDSFVQQFEQMQAQAVAHASAQLSQQAAEHDAEGTARDTVNYECTIRESVALQFERMRDALAAGGEQQLSSAEAVPVTARVVPASHHHASPYTVRDLCLWKNSASFTRVLL